MNPKQSRSLQVLIQRYEGTSSSQTRPSGVTRQWKSLHNNTDRSAGFTSHEREEKTLTLRHSVVPDPNAEEPLYAVVQKQSSVKMRDKSNMVSRGQRSSGARSRAENNISFSFPPFDSFYNMTVSVAV